MQEKPGNNHEEFAADGCDGENPRSRLLVTGLVLALAWLGGLVPLLIVGSRIISLDGERDAWAKEKSERLGELQRCNDLIAEKQERIRHLDFELNAVSQPLARVDMGAGEGLPGDRELVSDSSPYQEQAEFESRLAGLSQEFTSALKNLHDENMEIRQLMQAKTRDAARSVEGMDESKGRIAEIATEVDTLLRKRDDIREEFLQLTEQVKKQHDDLKQANLETGKLVELKKERADLLSSIAENRNTHQKLVETVASLNRERERNENRVAVFERESKKVAQELNAITNQFLENQTRQQELVKEIAALQNRRSRLTQDVQDSSRELAQLQIAVAENKAQLTELTAQLDASRVEISRRRQLQSTGELVASGKEGFVLPPPTAADTAGTSSKKDLADLEVKVFEAQIKSLQAEKNLLMEDVKKLQEQLRGAGADTRHKPSGDADSI